MDPAEFVRRNTVIEAPPLLPEIRLHLASEVTPIWQATEESLRARACRRRSGLLPGPEDRRSPVICSIIREAIAGRDLLDFGSGSGLVAIAAAKAGARSVLAAEIDHFAAAAIRANAALNDVSVNVMSADIIGIRNRRWEVVTAGDVCYEREMAERIVPWLRRIAGNGCLVLLGDPGRAYLPPTAGLVERARYLVPTSRELEDRDVCETTVWQVS